MDEEFSKPEDSLRKRSNLDKAKRNLKKKKALIKKRVDRVDSARDSYHSLKSIIAAAEGEKGIIDAEALEVAPPSAKSLIKEREIAWQPHPGVQTEFLKSNEDEVLFAGGRGSGKSDCLMIDPLRYCSNKNFRGLIIRRTMPELNELISRAQEIYPKAYKGATWKEQKKEFLFPSGAKIQFGYCDNVADVERYRGQQFSWLGIDEITQFPDVDIIDKLKGSLRTVDPTLKIYLRATTNPSGAGRGWVKKRFIDKAPSGVRFEEKLSTPIGDLIITRKWFNSTIRDNPTLLINNPQYVATLASYGDVLKKQWLDGDWSAFEGLAFSDFDENKHIVKPFEIPSEWYKFRACDWGFSSMAVCLWFAIDPYDVLYIYREFKTQGMTPDIFAERILEYEEAEHIRYGVLDGSAWSTRGEMGETPADTMINKGCIWMPSDRSKGSRRAGKLRMHYYLNNNKIKIFNTCRELISELSSLTLDPNNLEDVDSSKKASQPDHAWDACRYALLSRPEAKTRNNSGFSSDLNQLPPSDSFFGY